MILAWSNGWLPFVRPDPTLARIHLVYMTHLDVGFTLAARDVCDQCGLCLLA